MVATTLLKAFEVQPNAELKEVILTLPNTSDTTNTIAITLADYGIGQTGLLTVHAWIHTTDGSVLVVEAVTTAVSAGVLTVTLVTGTNKFRVIKIVGRGTAGVFV